ncbi:GDSL-type esterase/lipase family protein [Micrococcus luteus]|uniref:GDSL-type esterase/lipase family protein n=1 Tax=Micrococcus luteus TaxID=1270 RepID=UPI003D708F42
MSRGMKAVLAVSLALNVLLLAGAAWVVAQVGARPLAEQVGVLEARRPAYDVYAVERFDGLPGSSTVVIGDSQAELGPWSEILGGPVAVRGQGGATTAEIAGWTWAVPTSTARTIVLAGSNDVLLGTDHSRLRDDAERLYAALPGEVVAVGVPPLAGLETESAAANEVLREAADAAGATWVDPTAALTGPGLVRHDGVHLTGTGYEALARLLRTP